jgi:protein SCO1/2
MQIRPASTGGYMAPRFFLPITAVALVVAAAGLVACGGGGGTAQGGPTPIPTARMIENDFQGVLALPPYPKPDIVIEDTSGQPFDLRAETEGYTTLLYLGYTNCPDICPTHLADMAGTLKELPEEVSSQVKVIFITTDAERDTNERMRQYLDLFNPTFIGLRPTDDQLAQLLRNLSMRPIEKEDIGNGAYTVNHAAYVLAYSTDNVAHLVYPYGVTRENWLNDIELLVREGWTE